MTIKVQDAYRTPDRLHQKSPLYIIKTLNVQKKERILKAAREKGQVTYRGRIKPDFSIYTLKARKAWEDVLQTLRDHRCQPRLLYQEERLITIDASIKTKQFHRQIKSESKVYIEFI